MRVLIDATGVGYGGLRRLTAELEKQLTKSGVSFHIVHREAVTGSSQRATISSLLKAMHYVFSSRAKYDVLLSLSPSIVGIAWLGKKTVSNFNDFQSFLTNYELDPLRRAYRRLVYRIAWQLASAVTTISQHTAADVRRRYGVAKPIEVVPLSGALEIPPNLEHLQPEFDFLLPGHSAHKRVELALQALTFDRLKDTTALVLAGPREQELNGLVSRLGLNDRVKVFGALSNVDYVQTLMSGRALVLLSFGEGYGLPVAEALFLHKAVVISQDQALVETGGDAVLIADVDDIENVVRTMSAALSQSHSSDGYEQPHPIRERTWADVAQEFIRVCDSVN